MHRRTPITLLAALMLALALCAPALAQETDESTAGDEPAAVEAQGTGEDGPDGEPEGDAEASGEDDGFENTNGRDDVNCEEDFDFQEDAQEFFDSQGGLDGEDEDGLDEDRGEDDGIACETLPSRDDDSGSTPSGGVDSGAGGTAAKPDGGSIAPLVLGGLAATAALLAVLGVAVRRRV